MVQQFRLSRSCPIGLLAKSPSVWGKTPVDPVDNLTQMNGKPWYGQKECHGVMLCTAQDEILYSSIIFCLILFLPLCLVSPHPALLCWLWHWCVAVMSHPRQLTTEGRRRNLSSCSCGSARGEARGWDALDCQALCRSPPKNCFDIRICMKSGFQEKRKYHFEGFLPFLLTEALQLLLFSL